LPSSASTQKLTLLYKIEISWDIIGTVSLACSKLSAVFFYRRIFCVGGRKGWFEYTTQVTIAAIVCWLITFCFLAAFQCGSHFSALWDGTYNTYCVYSFPYLLGVSISGFLLDIWILILPIPRVLQLRASLSQKLSIIGVFLLALVGLGASTARMVTYVEVSTGGAAYYETHDPEAATTMASYTAMLEMGISLVAVNLPSLWLLFTQVVPEKVTQGLRSVASLTSIASRRSNSNSNSSPGSDADSDHTGSRKCSTTRSGSFAGEKANNDSVYVYNDDIEAARWGLHHTR